MFKKVKRYLARRGLRVVKCCRHSKEQLEQVMYNQQAERNRERLKTQMYRYY